MHLMKHLPFSFFEEKLPALLFSFCYLFLTYFCSYHIRKLLDIMQILINFSDVTETV